MSYEKQEAGSRKQQGEELGGIDARLEQMVRKTVGRELDGQCGRARAAFAEALADGNFRMGRGIRGAGMGTEDMEGERARRRLKLWAGAASAVAASLAVMVALQVGVGSKGAGVKSGGGAEAVAVKPVSVDQITFTRDVDGGTMVFDDAPVKVVRQQTLRQTQWFDPAEKATFSVTEPVEKVGYVRLRPD